MDLHQSHTHTHLSSALPAAAATRPRRAPAACFAVVVGGCADAPRCLPHMAPDDLTLGRIVAAGTRLRVGQQGAALTPPSPVSQITGVSRASSRQDGGGRGAARRVASAKKREEWGPERKGVAGDGLWRRHGNGRRSSTGAAGADCASAAGKSLRGRHAACMVGLARAVAAVAAARLRRCGRVTAMLARVRWRSSQAWARCGRENPKQLCSWWCVRAQRSNHDTPARARVLVGGTARLLRAAPHARRMRCAAAGEADGGVLEASLRFRARAAWAPPPLPMARHPTCCPPPRPPSCSLLHASPRKCDRCTRTKERAPGFVLSRARSGRRGRVLAERTVSGA
eukprot:356244-Chlamydomonas_euryale.AAC.3